MLSIYTTEVRNINNITITVKCALSNYSDRLDAVDTRKQKHFSIAYDLALDQLANHIAAMQNFASRGSFNPKHYAVINLRVGSYQFLEVNETNVVQAGFAKRV